MNDEEFEWKPINYVFHVQSAEDFYAQLFGWAKDNYPEVEVENTDLAKKMLEDIGISCK